MAEGGFLSSIKNGSDADFDVVCTPCEEDDIREEAVKYCPECNQYLCSTCTRCHRRSAASKSHKLLDKDYAKKSSVVVMVTKCRYHPDRSIEMYCETHDMVYCLKCIATDHRACDIVKSIDDVTPSVMQQKEIKRLQDETKDMHGKLVAAMKKKQKTLGALEEQNESILRSFDDAERNLIDHIAKLKREAVGTWNKKYSEIKGELESEFTFMNCTMSEVDKATTLFQNISSIDAGQQFIQSKLIQRSVKDAQKVCEESDLKGTRGFRFTENVDLTNAIMTETDLGRVETFIENRKQPAPRQYKIKAKKEINVQMQNDSQPCCISDVCQLQDGTIILTDYHNQRIKRLDTNLNIKEYCDVNGCPMGVCCTGENEVAVKTRNNKVQFISVGSSLAILRDISITGGNYWGMAFCEGELWVSTGGSINVYSTSGTLLKSINKHVNGQPIFKSTVCHMAVSGETVSVTDFSDGAVCFGKDGTVRREQREGQLQYCQGVCVSSDGTLFLSGYGSNNVMMFSGDGKCLGELMSKEMGVTCPFVLHYDNKNNRLLLTRFASCSKIYILEMCD